MREKEKRSYEVKNERKIVRERGKVSKKERKMREKYWVIWEEREKERNWTSKKKNGRKKEKEQKKKDKERNKFF